ncbi:protein of unknown function [Pseudodesulfovibrio profundus]|uniref:Uncharacterized protein n=1 Tax=Pseudodesulfovibrio profundus TaxID=57320 RepID=A0A2C8FAL6_9BACT|nr:hypothetical protein [Pseudodesulfovibrio profundus]SOB58926.1 protein of unknown function [Pseudodesulfovibrio profundus]
MLLRLDSIGIKIDLGDNVRIKIGELLVSLLFIFNGSAMILTEYYKIKGHPVYPWVPYMILLVGIGIPVLAWFLRSPKRNQEDKQ